MSLLPSAGLLAVNKPPGPTSRKVVDGVMRRLPTRKVGHAGTLDPFAEGLLLVLWGRATSLVPLLQTHRKEYRATVRFGRETDTQDHTGAVVAEAPVTGLDARHIEAALPAFRGSIRQAPPAFSAVKVGGERMYKKARRGETAPAAPRRREVFRFELEHWRPPVAVFTVVCSTGTYVRTLAHDLGRALGVGGSLDALCRTKVGRFGLEQAVAFDRLPEMGEAELAERVIRPAEAVRELPSVVLNETEIGQIAVGAWRDEDRRTVEPATYRLLDARGELLALVQGGAQPRLLRVFYEEGA